MKRYLILLLALVSCFFVACSPTETEDLPPSVPYETVVVDVANMVANVKISGDSIWTGSSFQDTNVLSEISVSLFGQTYTGSYKKSTNELYTSFVADYYDSDASESFAIERGTQRVVYLHMNEAYSDQSMMLPDIEDARGHAIAFAKERAAALINIDEYNMIVEEDPYTKQLGDEKYSCVFYYVMFAKKVNGFLSMEYVSFKISSKGQLVTYTAGEHPGTFDPNDFKECTSEMVTASILATMSREGNESSYRCKNIEQTRTPLFVLTPDGRYGVFSHVEVEWEHSKKVETEKGGYSVLTKFGELTGG